MVSGSSGFACVQMITPRTGVPCCCWSCLAACASVCQSVSVGCSL